MSTVPAYADFPVDGFTRFYTAHCLKELLSLNPDAAAICNGPDTWAFLQPVKRFANSYHVMMSFAKRQGDQEMIEALDIVAKQFLALIVKDGFGEDSVFLGQYSRYSNEYKRLTLKFEGLAKILSCGSNFTLGNSVLITEIMPLIVYYIEKKLGGAIDEASRQRILGMIDPKAMLVMQSTRQIQLGEPDKWLTLESLSYDVMAVASMIECLLGLVPENPDAADIVVDPPEQAKPSALNRSSSSSLPPVPVEAEVENPAAEARKKVRARPKPHVVRKYVDNSKVALDIVSVNFPTGGDLAAAANPSVQKGDAAPGVLKKERTTKDASTQTVSQDEPRGFVDQSTQTDAIDSVDRGSDARSSGIGSDQISGTDEADGDDEVFYPAPDFPETSERPNGPAQVEQPAPSARFVSDLEHEVVAPDSGDGETFISELSHEIVKPARYNAVEFTLPIAVSADGPLDVPENVRDDGAIRGDVFVPWRAQYSMPALRGYSAPSLKGQLGTLWLTEMRRALTVHDAYKNLPAVQTLNEVTHRLLGQSCITTTPARLRELDPFVSVSQNDLNVLSAALRTHPQFSAGLRRMAADFSGSVLGRTANAPADSLYHALMSQLLPPLASKSLPSSAGKDALPAHNQAERSELPGPRASALGASAKLSDIVTTPEREREFAPVSQAATGVGNGGSDKANATAAAAPLRHVLDVPSESLRPEPPAPLTPQQQATRTAAVNEIRQPGGWGTLSSYLVPAVLRSWPAMQDVLMPALPAVGADGDQFYRAVLQTIGRDATQPAIHALRDQVAEFVGYYYLSHWTPASASAPSARSNATFVSRVSELATDAPSFGADGFAATEPENGSAGELGPEFFKAWRPTTRGNRPASRFWLAELGRALTLNEQYRDTPVAREIRQIQDQFFNQASATGISLATPLSPAQRAVIQTAFAVHPQRHTGLAAVAREFAASELGAVNSARKNTLYASVMEVLLSGEQPDTTMPDSVPQVHARSASSLPRLERDAERARAHVNRQSHQAATPMSDILLSNNGRRRSNQLGTRANWAYRT
ncbi:MULTISPECIES: hypothetical protein [unclassified Undibacterium]|uniref:hypothetical protein n=1 Tax=unclassified Undibacterium TaxID=2630295 RepID=UPI002B23BCDB|nr:MULTISPECIES: hypothetical protein [unclassified Undibacterium]MEB0216566.1 hypothetical protein [Undibacterium sp. 5I2]